MTESVFDWLDDLVGRLTVKDRKIIAGIQTDAGLEAFAQSLQMACRDAAIARAKDSEGGDTG